MEQAIQFYEFGPFRVDPSKRTILRDRDPVSLTPKAFDMLLVLIENRERVLEKGELMKKLWPDSFVEEANLTQNVFMLRRTLGETPTERYIVTVPGRGYRFVAQVREVCGEPAQLISEAQAPSASRGLLFDPTPQSKGRHELGSRHTLWLVTGVSGLMALAAALTWLLLSPAPQPRVLSTRQITHFGHVQVGTKLVADGARLYFVERSGGRLTLAEVAIEGGDPVPIPTPFPNTTLLDISPDRSQLLVSGGSGEDEQPLWTLPTARGSPRRLGELTAQDAAWSADGSRIAYARGTDLYVASRDGSNSRRLVHSEGQISDPKWSPTDDKLRFTVTHLKTLANSLWEVSAQGTNLHPVLPQWKQGTSFQEGECCGRWTGDGRYFIFWSARAFYSLWAIPERPGLFHQAGRGPVEFYAGSTMFAGTLPSNDGKRLFLATAEEQRELVRYDAQLKQFAPFLSGIPARTVTFSRDRHWVAYQNTVDATLWRSRADGTDRLQLTFPPLTVWGLGWSPDGSQIAFSASTYGTSGKIYLISRDGGSPQALMPGEDVEINPSWSPDGKSLLFARQPAGSSQILALRGTESIPSVCLLDLTTRQITTLPGSEGLTEPRWSPDARYVVARTDDNRKVMLFDFQARHWTELATVHVVHGMYFSSDSRDVYFQDIEEGEDQPIYRINVHSRKLERVAGRKQLLRADVNGYGLSGLTPDDSPLATLVRSNCDIYALDVDFP